MRWKVQDKKNIKSRIRTVFCLFPRKVAGMVYWLETIQIYQEKTIEEYWYDGGLCEEYECWNDKYVIEKVTIEPEWKSQN